MKPWKDGEKEENRMFGDPYDVMNTGVTVHSYKLKEWLNEDFIFADLNDRERLLVQRTLIAVRHIIGFLDIDKFEESQKVKIGKEILEKKGYSKAELTGVDDVALDITGRIVGDLQARAILTRSKSARVIEAVVSLIKKKATEEEEKKKETIVEQMKPEESDL